MYPRICQRRIKLRFQNIVYTAEDEIYTFHRGIDRAEFLNRERESSFEKLLVKVFDNRLLALKVIDLAHVKAYRLIESLECTEVFVYRFGF